MQRFSLLGLLRNAASGHRDWKPFWRDAVPRQSYDAVIVGGGGHGLATAYYLAKNHGLHDVAVLEKGWIGGGNTGRNTTIIRSNYLWNESGALYEHALKLWEGLNEDLNINLMFSQRGVLNLAHNLADVREGVRRVEANRLNGIDAEWLAPEGVKAFCPIIDIAKTARYPVLGGTLQRRAGTARHDTLAWGLARAADALGVDIIQNCEVTGILREDGRVTGLRTTRGTIMTPRVGIVAAGHTSVLASMADIRLPLQSHPLQALVSEPVKPILPCVVMSNAVHVYLSQSDKGELVVGAGIDAYNSYSQRGSFHIIEHQMAALIELFPVLSRLRMLRTWGGIVDVCPDASPIISRTPVRGLYINCGWGTGGFKATPGSGWVFAHTLATGEPHPLNAPFALDRFTSGALIDEHGAAAVAH
jgi:sarcosine oxidase, subunit beta